MRKVARTQAELKGTAIANAFISSSVGSIPDLNMLQAGKIYRATLQQIS